MTVLIAFYVSFLFVMGWLFICNHRTRSQRIVILDRVANANRASGYAADYWPSFHSVSYERHLFLLATFRNPINYYVGLPEAK